MVLRIFILIIVVLVASCPGGFCPGGLIVMADETESVLFARDIQPLLAKHCLLCHGPDSAEAGLRLDISESATGILASGLRAVVPGDVAASELLTRVASEDDSLRMPPDGERLSAAEISHLSDWIRAGAVYDQHWAYRPVVRPALPRVENEEWVRQPLDRFALHSLEQHGIQPATTAAPATLMKRLSYDLLGLPPTPTQIDDFVQAADPDAYERLVDRLLASEHFGERWGRHWLDKARYADSDGYEKDRPRPTAWRYRDWVIDAINRDMPFDQFTVEQLAGDLLPNASPEQRLATAFQRQTLTNTEGGTDQEEFRVEATFDRTETTAAVWMGLTMNCARCHAHKYDRITQQEYYQLFAFFNEANEADGEIARSAAAMTAYVSAKASHDDEIAVLQRQYEAAKAKLTQDLKRWLCGSVEPLGQARWRTVKNFDSLAKQLIDLQAKTPVSPLMPVPIMKSAERNTRVLYRGDFLQPGEGVEPSAIGVLGETHPLQARRPGAKPDRLDLANWLVDSAHPLTARVTVNQVWAQLFGQGIVASVNDFGVRGELPTHPEMLDWLAWSFSHEMGWSRKRLIKSIVMSATYRQSSAHRPELLSIDPLNHWLARQNRLRVEAEIVRDLYLAVSGLLSGKVGGPSVFPPLPQGVAELSYANNFKWVTSNGEDAYRRGMYTFFKRTSPHPTLISFDCPDSNTASLRREVSNTPLQALVTLNNDVFAQAAQAMAQQVLSESHSSDRERLTNALRRCVARVPQSEEVDLFYGLLQTAREHYVAHGDEARQLTKHHAAGNVPAEENAAWSATLRMVLNLDEFIVRD